MTSTVKRCVPPPTLVKMGNPLVRMLLGSPLHGVLDDSFLVLHLTGHKTGRRYDIPVGYVDMEGRLTVVPASVAVSYQAMIDRIGPKKALRQLGISLPGGRAPTALELKDAAREYGWSVITLTPR